MASSHGMLRNDSVNTLGKECLFERINEWKQIEFRQEAERRKEALKSRNIPPSGYKGDPKLTGLSYSRDML